MKEMTVTLAVACIIGGVVLSTIPGVSKDSLLFGILGAGFVFGNLGQANLLRHGAGTRRHVTAASVFLGLSYMVVLAMILVIATLQIPGLPTAEAKAHSLGWSALWGWFMSLLHWVSTQED